MSCPTSEADGEYEPLWHRTSHGEERVDDIVLPHEDRTKEVRDDDEAKVTRVVAAHAEEKDEHNDVDDKHDAEEPPVEREDLVANISSVLALSLVGQVLVLVALPSQDLCVSLFDGRHFNLLGDR